MNEFLQILASGHSIALQLQVTLLNSITFQEMVKLLARTPSMRDLKLKLKITYVKLLRINKDDDPVKIFVEVE